MGSRASGLCSLWYMGSLVEARELSSCGMWGLLFPDQGLNLCPLYWKVDSLQLDYQGNLSFFSIVNTTVLHNLWLVESAESWGYRKSVFGGPAINYKHW